MGLKIVFMGTPSFASHMLEGLISSAHKVVAVVTEVAVVLVDCLQEQHH